jgi:hypothetical protein
MPDIVMMAGNVSSVSVSLKMDKAITVTHTCAHTSADGLHCPHCALGSLVLNQAAHVLYVAEGKYVRSERP